MTFNDTINRYCSYSTLAYALAYREYFSGRLTIIGRHYHFTGSWYHEKKLGLTIGTQPLEYEVPQRVCYLGRGL